MKRFITILIVAGVIGFLSLSARATEDPQTLTFELLAKTTYSENSPVFPAELSKLAGKRVRLSGFMFPYDEAKKFTQLVLVDTANGCFFCGPPRLNAVVFVRRPATDPPLDSTSDFITFEGILHLWNSEMKDDDNAKGFFFTIDDARVPLTSHGLSSALQWIKNKFRAE